MPRKLFNAQLTSPASTGLTFYKSQYIDTPIQTYITLTDFHSTLLSETRSELPELNQIDRFKGGKPIKFIEPDTIDAGLKILTSQTLSAGGYLQTLRRLFPIANVYESLSEIYVPIEAKYGDLRDSRYGTFTMNDGSVLTAPYITPILQFFRQIPLINLKKVILCKDDRTNNGWLTAVVLRNNGSLEYYSEVQPPNNSPQTLTCTSSFREYKYPVIRGKIVRLSTTKDIEFTITHPPFMAIDNGNIANKTFSNIKQYGNSVIALSDTGEVFRCDISTGTFTDDFTQSFVPKSYPAVGLNGNPKLESGSVKLRVAIFNITGTITEPTINLPTIVVNWTSAYSAPERRYALDPNGKYVKDSFGTPVIGYYTPSPKTMDISLRLNGDPNIHDSVYDLVWGDNKFTVDLNRDNQFTFPYSPLLEGVDPVFASAVLKDPIVLGDDIGDAFASEVRTDLTNRQGYTNYIYREITIPYNATVGEVATALNNAFGISSTSPDRFWFSTTRQGTSSLNYSSWGSIETSSSLPFFLTEDPCAIRKRNCEIRVAIVDNTIKSPIFFKIKNHNQFGPEFSNNNFEAGATSSISRSVILTSFAPAIAEEPFNTSSDPYQQSRFLWDKSDLPVSTTATNIFTSTRKYAILLSDGSILTDKGRINKSGILSDVTITKVALGDQVNEYVMMLSSSGRVFTSGQSGLGVASFIEDKPDLIYEVNFGSSFNSKIIDIACRGGMSYALAESGAIYFWSDGIPKLYTGEKVTKIDNLITYSSSSLPSGLTISKSGLISGKPSVSGTFNSQIKVTKENLIITDTVTSSPAITTTESYIDYITIPIEIIDDTEQNSNVDQSTSSIVVETTQPIIDIYQSTTGSSSTNVELFAVEVPLSSLTSASKSINMLFSTTRIQNSEPLQTYDIKLSGISIFNNPFQLNSTGSTSALFAIKIQRISSTDYKVDCTINYFYGTTKYTVTNSKIIARSSVSNPTLYFTAINSAGSNAPILATRSELTLI
jgi:hypothetical protein